jgi:hypothetical protein
LITNLLVGFFLAPRGDRKRFDILTIISNVLHLTEDQKEQIGLTRPKNGGNSSNNHLLSPTTIEQPQKEVNITIYRKSIHSSFFFNFL